MSKALMVWRIQGGAAIASGVETTPFGSGAGTTEANAQTSATEAATFSALRGLIVSGGSGTNTLQFRDATANGALVGSRAGTGLLEDATHSDLVDADALFNYAYTDTGTNSAFTWVSTLVEFSSGHGNFHGVASSSICDAESSTRYFKLAGNVLVDGDATETNTQWKNRGYTSFEALQARCSANARTNTSSFRNRINAGFGSLQCDFASGVTGLVVDKTPTDALADGDLINASLTLDTGVEDLTVTIVAATLKSSTSKSETWSAFGAGHARAASATATYNPIGGALGNEDPTEANSRIKVGFAARVSNLRCYLSANTYGGNGTLKLYQNGSPVLTTTLTASGGAGWYENTSDTIDIDDDDELSFEFDEGTSGTITIQSVGITFAPIAAKILPADGNSFALSVADAGLSWGHSFAADSDSFALTVADAGLAWAHNLSVETGDFVLSGGDVGFGALAPLSAEFGAFTLTGSDAELSTDAVVIAPVIQQTSVGGGGLSWKDFVEAEFRRKHLSHLLDVEEKKLEKVEKKLKVVRKKLKSLKTEPPEGILANLQALEFKREKIENKIQALEVEMVPLELFLEAEIDEDDEEVMGIFH
jgi:hypothetical protein